MSGIEPCVEALSNTHVHHTTNEVSHDPLGQIFHTSDSVCLSTLRLYNLLFCPLNVQGLLTLPLLQLIDVVIINLMRVIDNDLLPPVKCS